MTYFAIGLEGLRYTTAEKYLCFQLFDKWPQNKTYDKQPQHSSPSFPLPNPQPHPRKKMSPKSENVGARNPLISPLPHFYNISFLPGQGYQASLRGREKDKLVQGCQKNRFIDTTDFC